LDIFWAALLVAFMFNMLRQLESWLHQHIFKVGWLLTKNFQTTTILYYTFFMPGVFLYEAVYWLTAGVFNVHAERAISWPEKQEVGELKLNFVKVDPKTPQIILAIISAMPLIIGFFLVWFIANDIFDISSVLLTMKSGSLSDISAGIRQLTNTPDFWPWAYLLFVIGNTMIPDFEGLSGWKWILVVLIIATIPLFILGVGDELVGGTVITPLVNILNILSETFAVIIVFNLIAVALLGATESTIEHITGDSATFKNGKMIVMRREEAIAERKKARQKARATKKQRQTEQGPPSIYKIILPVPGAPGKEPVTQTSSIVAPDDSRALPSGGGRPRRDEPSVVKGTARVGLAADDIKIGPAGLRQEIDLEDDDEKKPDSKLPAKAIEKDNIDPRSSFGTKPAPKDNDKKTTPARPFGSSGAKPATDRPRFGDKPTGDDRRTTPARPSGSSGTKPTTDRPRFGDKPTGDDRRTTPARPSGSSGEKPATDRPRFGDKPTGDDKQPARRFGTKPAPKDNDKKTSPARPSGSSGAKPATDRPRFGDKPTGDDKQPARRFGTKPGTFRTGPSSPQREADKDDDNELTYEDVEESP
jgi:hypothetical protein